jgi:hypothetical protein
MLKRDPKQSRRGVILIVVLMLLTLFAIIGVSFVLYADAEAASARLDRESKALTRADLDPQQALFMVLGQVLYGVDDQNGIYSGIRGYDLASAVYGNANVYDPNTNSFYALGNTAPFTGNGRLHYTYPNPYLLNGKPTLALQGQDDWSLVNYTYFPGDPFIRDPNRFGTRTALLQTGQGDPRQAQPYMGASGVPYTYPDHNNFYLGVIRASDGAVLVHSFHRPWMGFGSLDPKTNPAGWTSTNPTTKYTLLRPHPSQHPKFPLPEDAGGDVKNFIGGPGYWDPIQQKFCNNDSFWIDPGLPPITGPDGKSFKVMAAMLIVDMGGRVDVNAHGNLAAARTVAMNRDHRSNQGFGPWEVSLKQALSSTGSPNEWLNLFVGRQANNAVEVQGKYGFNHNLPTNPYPGPTGNAPGGRRPHIYAPVDYDAMLNGTFGTLQPGDPTPKWSPNPTGTNPYGTFNQTAYLNGDATNGNPVERVHHPLLYNAYRAAPANPWTITSGAGTSPDYNLRFPASDMERLLRFSDTDGPSLSSQLERLCPLTFNNPLDVAGSLKRRLLVTTDSSDYNAPGVFPYVYAPPAMGGTFQNYPTQFVNGVPAGPPIGDWRAAVTAALRRINLNRPLTPYPTYPNGNDQTQVTYGMRFDTLTGAQRNQFLQAQQDRQVFANDIYRTLLAVTGVKGATPDVDLQARRWLAQLAVNIVDYIDEDDISTPFNFFNADDGNPVSATGIGATSPTSGSPLYWVFGTELPHLVLNEALAMTPNAALGQNITNAQVSVWLELYNPFTAANATTQPQDAWPVPLYQQASGMFPEYAPYRIEVSNGGINTAADNVLGTALGVQNFTKPLDFQPAAPLINGGTQPNQAGVTGAYVPAPQGTFLIGPNPNPSLPTGVQDPFKAVGQGGTVPINTPTVRSGNLQYTKSFSAAVTNDERALGLTILLRRLANPHLPENPQAVIPNPGGTPPFVVNPLYNPYITVDYLDKVPLRDNTPATRNYVIDGTPGTNTPASRGRRQPYAASTNITATAGTAPIAVTADSPVVDQPTPSPQTVNHTFGKPNNPQFPVTGRNDWLVHLDRQVISPMELLHVSGYQPFRLTQQFVLHDKALVNLTALDKFQHVVPWFDPLVNGAGAPASNRLYRLFEFLETNNRGAGNPRAGRHTGKINLNAVWDLETFRALCDAQISNIFTSSTDPSNPGDVEKIWAAFMKARSPDPNGGTNYVPGPVGLIPTEMQALNPATGPQYFALNRPLLSLATGLSPGVTQGDNQNRNVRSINDTLLQQSATNAQLRLFEPQQAPGGANEATAHPYQRFELLTKIFNNVTTRSNVFAVWITVGFFDYDPNTGQIGAEIGRSEGRHVRHRLFSIVDRSQARCFSTATTAAITAGSPNTSNGSLGYTLQPLNLNTTAVTDTISKQTHQVIRNGNTGMNWVIRSPNPALVQPLILVYQPGNANEEIVTAVPVAITVAGGGTEYQLQARFTLNHSVTSGTTTTAGTVQCFGNPGPWTRYDPRKDNTGVVLHYSIID